MKVKRILKLPSPKGRSKGIQVDIDIIIAEIEEQTKLAQIHVLNNNEPTIHTMRKMLKIVEDYIIKNERIVYGGTAIETFLKVKNSPLTLIDDPLKIKDYDFYTPNHEIDSITIANLLHESGFKYARRVKALHAGTWRTSAEFSSEFVSDATFVPEEIYSKLPYVKIGLINYIDPQYLKIDLYASVSNPHKNYYRWEKSYKRLIELERLYPISAPFSITEQNQKILLNLPNIKGDIIVGVQAYNAFMGKNKALPINHYTFYSYNPEKDANKAKKKGFHITHHRPYLDIFDEHYELRDNKGKLVAEWYDIGSNCIGMTMKNIADYHWLLRFLYGKYIIDGILKENENDKNLYSYMIKTLQEEYMKNQTLHLRDLKNPFRILQIECVNTDKENEPELIDFKKEFNTPNIEFSPVYKPEKNIIDPSGIKIEYKKNLLGELF